MADLSPRGRAVIESGKRALRASAADRARVEAALRARLGGDVLPPEPPPAPLSPRGSFRFVAGAATAVVMGGVLVFSLTPRGREAPVPTKDPVVVHDAAIAHPSALERASSESVEVVTLPSPPPPVATERTSRAARTRDRLGQEVVLMTRATSALKAGRTADALAALDAHRRRFPRGALSEERHAATAQALCTLGRVREGRAELARLSPSSPAGVRARQLCDAAERTRSTRE